MAMIKKSQMLTLILCQDRDFKHRAVNFMNNIAFQAEKISVETLEEAKEMLEKNPLMLNLIIDGQIIGEQLNDHFQEIAQLCQKPGLMAMLYLNDKQMTDFKHQNHGISNLVVKTLPFLKPDFNDVFHNRSEQSSKALESSSQGSVNKTSSAPTTPKKSLTVFEASQHVKETVEHINAISLDRSNIQAVLQVGQRFNGMMGAFSFLQSKVGMAELKRLAEVIDGIAKTYESNPKESISENHFQLLLNAAKCAFKILMQLRDDPTKLSEDLIADEHKIFELFGQDKELVKRDSQSQSQVDDLLKSFNV